MRFPWLKDGFVALVQGASRGIGLETVRQLLACEQVGRVIATARTASVSPDLAELQRLHGDRLLLRDLDVTDAEAITALATGLDSACDGLGLLFNVAGVLHDDTGLYPEKQLRDVSLKQLERSFRVNAFGPLLMAQAFAPKLLRSRHAVLANLSARVGSLADNRLGGWYAYRGAKAAQNMFTRNLAIELGRRSKGVCCVALHPGTTDTILSAPFQSRVPQGKLFTVGFTVSRLLSVIADLTAEDNGRFIAWDGQDIPW